MKVRGFPYALSLAVALGFGSSAMATTATSTFNVTITVNPSCDFKTTSISDLAFGSVAASAAATGDTTFKLQCTVGTAPVISLSSANSWSMKGQDTTPYDNTSASIAYKLYSDSAHTAEWNGTSTQTALSDGTEQTFTAYGNVADAGTTAGNYKDVVTVTLTY